MELYRDDFCIFLLDEENNIHNIVRFGSDAVFSRYVYCEQD